MNSEESENTEDHGPGSQTGSNKRLKVEDKENVAEEIRAGGDASSASLGHENYSDEDSLYIDDFDIPEDDSDFLEMVDGDDEGEEEILPIEGYDYEMIEEVDDNSINDDLALSSEKAMEYMKNIKAEVSDVLQVSPTQVNIIMTHYGWNKQKVFDAFYEADTNVEKLFRENGFVDPSAKSKSTASSSTTKECEICLDTSDKMLAMECGHDFCTSCWSSYLTSGILDQGISHMLKCPGVGCKILVSETIIDKLVTDEHVKTRYNELLLDNFVETNKDFAWCPSPKCNNAIKISKKRIDLYKPVKCDCGEEFCFDCSGPDHNPVTCNQLTKWLKKNQDDSETCNWMELNTKACPKCKTPIEKNGGCNHMTCRKSCCQYQFCWICLGSWSEHGWDFYNCNRYKSKSDEITKSKTRENLTRYLFYFRRYSSHMQSRKLESKLYNLADKIMDQFQNEHGMSWVDAQFLRSAVDSLIRSRQTLTNTYVFGFYLDSNHQATIFEDNQSDLERATESLSELLEHGIDLTLESLESIKVKVNAKSQYCESRRKTLIDHVKVGREEGWWIYRDTAE